METRIFTFSHRWQLRIRNCAIRKIKE